MPVLFLSLAFSGELIEQAPFIEIDKRDEGSSEGRQELLGVVVVVIEMIFLLVQHILEEGNGSASQ